MPSKLEIKLFDNALTLSDDETLMFIKMLAKVKFHHQSSDTNAFAFTTPECDLYDKIFETIFKT